MIMLILLHNNLLFENTIQYRVTVICVLLLHDSLEYCTLWTVGASRAGFPLLYLVSQVLAVVLILSTMCIAQPDLADSTLLIFLRLCMVDTCSISSLIL